MSKGCQYEAPTFGAGYPDGTCIDGWMWDLDSGDGDGLTSGGDEPCPYCNTVEYLEWQGLAVGGNARQRRKARRAEVKRVQAWAISRSTFHPVTGENLSRARRAAQIFDVPVQGSQP